MNSKHPAHSNKQAVPTMRWRCKNITTSLSHVPTEPGLYAYGHDAKNLHGLDAGRIYVYVGESDNLRRRLKQHLPINEKNPQLQNYFRKYRSVAKCWYCVMTGVSAETRRGIEDELIKFFKPRFNTRGK